MDTRARRNLLKKIESDLVQAQSVLKQMEVEARAEPSKSLKPVVRKHKARVRSLRDSLKKIKARSERDELMNSRGGSSYDDRDRFERITARMEDSTDTLLQSKRTLAETEDIAPGNHGPARIQ